MKTLNLENLGVQELDAKEMGAVDGGKDWWGHIQAAYNRLTDDAVGTLAVAIMPGPSLLAIGIGGTINYLRE